ncbi:hypothetical protein SLA2020_153380 [Shorea laevis]
MEQLDRREQINETQASNQCYIDFPPRVALDMMESDVEYIISLKLITDPAFDEMSQTKFNTSSSLIVLNDRTCTGCSSSVVEIFLTCHQYSPYGAKAMFVSK